MIDNDVMFQKLVRLRAILSLSPGYVTNPRLHTAIREVETWQSGLRKGIYSENMMARIMVCANVIYKEYNHD